MSGYNYTLGAIFSEIATEFSHHPALIFSDKQQVTFGELETISNRLTGYLAAHGVRTGSIVALFHDKSTTAYAANLACLKLGAVYVSLDPNSPIERLSKIISSCQPTMVLMGRLQPEQGGYLNGYPVHPIGDTQFLKDLSKYGSDTPTVFPPVNGNDPAYLMFTSGSTGFPKGVVIPHSAVINFIYWSRNTFSITPQDTLTGINPPYFDNSIFDFYASLFNGASLAPIADQILKTPLHMVEAIQQLGCSIWFSVPSLFVFTLKMRALKQDDLPKLRLVVFGGEGFPKAPLRQLYTLLGEHTKFINVYGPSECTCICSSYQVSAADMESSELLPLGTIADNFSFNILDKDDKQVLDGAIGELCLKGPQLGLGYYNNKEQTKKSFTIDPLIDEFPDRIYRTGDLVSYEKEPQLLWFAGRMDNQIKRMGYRIELEEIEASLGGLPYIDEAICVYLQLDKETSGKIIARVSPECDEQQVLDDLRHYLPLYMLPNIVRSTTVLPKNPNGKVDRNAILTEEMQVLEA